jgi:hypothetical protein
LTKNSGTLQLPLCWFIPVIEGTGGVGFTSARSDETSTVVMNITDFFNILLYLISRQPHRATA